MTEENLSNKVTDDVSSPVFVQSDTGARKILSAQLFLTLLTAFAFLYFEGFFAAQSAIFGGFIAMLNVWSTERKLQMAAKMSQQAPGSEVALLYIGAVQRFVVTLILFVVGMFFLKLSPLALMAAFAAAQAGYFLKSNT